MRMPAELPAWIQATLADVLPAAALGEQPGFDLIRLPAEASTRSFFRVVPRVAKGASTFIAMHSPPKTEDNPRYIRLAALFRAHGLATPQVHAADLARGFLLLDDLGERDFEAAYAAGEVDAPLDAAIRDLVALQAVVSDDIPPYTAARFADELAIFTHSLVGRLLELAVPDHFAAAREALIAATQSVPQCTVHRDYHCRNLLWRTDGTVGIVDFQDALVGPASYDLASLLRDCYHEFGEAALAHWQRRYLDLADLDCDAATFSRAVDLTAIQRQLKAVGIFARLYLDRGRRRHIGDIVPVLGRIARLGRRYSETTALAEWLASDVLPCAARRIAALP